MSSGTNTRHVSFNIRRHRTPLNSVADDETNRRRSARLESVINRLTAEQPHDQEDTDHRIPQPVSTGPFLRRNLRSGAGRRLPARLINLAEGRNVGSTLHLNSAGEEDYSDDE